MTKRAKITLAVLLIAIAGGIALQILRPEEREPVYQGKQLSVWLDSSGPAELTNAVRQIGTNGIPTLLKMFVKRDSSSVSRLVDLWDRHVIRLGFLPAFVRYPDWYLHRAQHVNDSALKGFKILGAAAKQAVPALIDIYEQHSSLLFISSFALLAAVGMTFIDVRMPPGWDGVETTVNIWKFDPDLQVLIHPCVFAIYSSLARRVLA